MTRLRTKETLLLAEWLLTGLRTMVRNGINLVSVFFSPQNHSYAGDAWHPCTESWLRMTVFCLVVKMTKRRTSSWLRAEGTWLLTEWLLTVAEDRDMDRGNLAADRVAAVETVDQGYLTADQVAADRS